MDELVSVLLFPHCFQNTQTAKSRAKGAIDDQGPGVPPSNPVTSESFPFQRKLLIPARTPCSQPCSPPGSGSRPSTARAPAAQEGESSPAVNPAPALPPSPSRSAAPASASGLTSILASLAPHYSAGRDRQLHSALEGPASQLTYLNRPTTLLPRLRVLGSPAW